MTTVALMISTMCTVIYHNKSLAGKPPLTLHNILPSGCLVCERLTIPCQTVEQLNNFSINLTITLKFKFIFKMPLAVRTGLNDFGD